MQHIKIKLLKFHKKTYHLNNINKHCLWLDPVSVITLQIKIKYESNLFVI